MTIDKEKPDVAAQAIVSQADGGEFPKNRSKSSGSETCYSVEARYNFPAPVEISGQIFDERWREVKFEENPVGVPRASQFQEHTLRHRMLGYSAAQALRWWLHANADAMKAGMCACLETRLVKHTIKHSCEIEAVSVHAHIHGEDRSSYMPDWGQHVHKSG